MLKAIFFDCDGTLFDTSFPIFAGYKYLFDKFRPDYKPTAEEYYSFLGPSLSYMFPKYFKEDLDLLIAEYRKAGDGFMDKEHIVAYPNLLETISLLKSKNIKIGIISSRMHFSIINILKIYGLENTFDVVIGCDDTPENKPSSKPFEIALNALEITSSEALMIGDHLFDIKGALNANICPVAVQWTTYDIEELKKEGVKYFLDDYKNLFKIIDDYNEK